jgi:WD40 repeat protein
MTDTRDPDIAIAREREHVPLALDYAHRLPPRFPKLHALWRGFIELGPVFPWPSILTLALLFLPAGAAWWLTYRPQPWHLITSYNTSQTNGQYPSLLYLRKLDAIASSDGNGGLKIWRPFTGETLFTTELPPAALPPNRPPGRSGDYWQLTASADESKILAKCDLGDFIWDAQTGQLIGQLSTTWLGPEFGKLPFSNLGALSPDGSRLAVVNEAQDLLLYDISHSAKPKLVAKRHLNRPTRPNDPTPDLLTFGVFFNPTGTHILVLTDTMFWIGDTQTLAQRAYLTPDFCSPTESDFKFLHGGDRLLIANRGFDVRLYDLATMKILRHWPMPHNPSRIAVSPDERHAFVGQSEQASLVLDLEDDTGRIERLAPPQQWFFAQPEFFPDNRRIVVSEVWQYLTGVIDMQTGRQVALIPNPPRDWVSRQTLISRDGNKIALMGQRQVHVYQQVGGESALGIAATLPFWALVLSMLLLAASLSRDALRTCRRWGRTATSLSRRRAVLAALMIAAGALAMVTPVVWVVVEWKGLDKELWWFEAGWLVWLTIFHLFAGLGLLMKSRAWTIVTALLMLADIVVASYFARYWPGFPLHPTRIFDRMWLLPARGVLVATLIWATLAAAALLSLLPIRRRRVHS